MNLEFKGGVFLPDLDLWLDPHASKRKHTGFVSHAHSDHAKWHGTTLCTRATLRLMRHRQPHGSDKVSTPEYGQPFEYKDARLTLLPAGHIAGSAQLLVERAGERLLYSGDFKLRTDPSCEALAFTRAETLVMETTFGKPQYVFPSYAAVTEKLAAFCRAALDEGAVPVLLVYSLGKAQEVLKSLQPFGFEFLLHPSVAGITEVYRQMGYQFPPCQTLGQQTAQGRVLICPPQGREHDAVLAIPRTRSAFLSGWAMDKSARYRFGVDEAFAMSDHADFDELMTYVRQVQPKKIYTHHGFAREFASHLRRQGYDATALGEEEQLELL